MATLTAKQVTLADPDPGLAAAAAGGDSAPVTAGNALLVRNADASSHTVTLELTGVPTSPFYASANSGIDVAVPADDVRVIPLSNAYLDDGTGVCALTYDAVTSLKVAVIKL